MSRIPLARRSLYNEEKYNEEKARHTIFTPRNVAPFVGEGHASSLVPEKITRQDHLQIGNSSLMAQRTLDFTEHKRNQLGKYLSGHFEGEVRFDETSLRLYSTDASIYEVRPLGVLVPKTRAALQTCVQLCLELELPIIPRGGGSSCSGQSIGAGIVIDCSKYLNRVLQIDPQGRRVVVEPGVVLDQLNREAGQHGLQFGPDVTNAGCATLGGMIGNNSAGVRSIVYGKTIDHVQSLEVLLGDGNSATFDALAHDEWSLKESGRTLEAQLYHSVRRIAERNLDEIKRRFPKVPCRVSGYNLDVFAKKFTPSTTKPPAAGLHQLVVGSEGTLAFVTKAELTLVPKPHCVGLLVPQFRSMREALDSVANCLEYNPSAVELLEGELLLAIEHLRKDQGRKQEGEQLPFRLSPESCLLLVEMSGASETEVWRKLNDLKFRLERTHRLTAAMATTEPNAKEQLWRVMRLAANGLPSGRQTLWRGAPVPFVEDTAVPPAVLPEFAMRFQEVLKAHETTGAFYGHAAAGCLHVRPVLDLKRTQDIDRMRKITEDITTLVKHYDGSLSGEHGDGFARSEWTRKMFGPRVYQAFCQVKTAFDPNNLFNPGKIVHAPSMTENLRAGGFGSDGASPKPPRELEGFRVPNYRPKEPGTVFDYLGTGGFARSVELCNGSGVCRKIDGGTMCPSYRVTRDEKDSTRGRANSLRLALASEDPVAELRKDATHDVFDLCVMCKACKSECPNSVDVGKFKSEFLNIYHRASPRPPFHFVAGWLHRWYPIAAAFPELANWLGRNGIARWWMEQLGGVDRRRTLPRLHRKTFRRWFARHKPHPKAGFAGKVLLLDDCFTNYNEPEIGKAAVAVLEASGHSVELVSIPCCGRPMITLGFLPHVRKLVGQQVSRLAQRAQHATAILGLEPSCLLTLVDEWPELVPSQATRVIAAKTHQLDHWLASQLFENRFALRFHKRQEKCVVHGHCHQKALLGAEGTVEALRLIPQLNVTLLETGCCGMAGPFGYERQHYDVSVAIANQELLSKLREARPATVVAPGTSCRHQIRDLAATRAMHPLEVLAQQMET